MTPQELMGSILQLAIQGKLVPQISEEGTGEELFQQIQAEKQRLIKEGIIKKEKPLPEITEDEIPFDIPESWRWVRFSDVLDVRDGTHDTPKYVTSGIPLVTSKNLVDGKIEFETTKLISVEDAQAINMRSAVDDGDILFAMIGTIGNPVLVKKDREFCIKNMALFKAINQELISMDYLLLFLENEQCVMKKKASGGVQSFVSLKFLRTYLLPLPPLDEQKRIVAKIEELLPLIDRYEQAWSKLEDFNKRFPVDMQKSILQAAIQGKLVEQRPEEGTGEELFQQIQAEKQRLIKEGKIKKEKLLPEITEDEIPFDIPDSWKWARLGHISWYFDAGKSPNCLKQPVVADDWGVITTTSVQLGHFDELQNKILPSDFKVNTEIQVRSGDILITRAGPTNRTGIACLVKDIHYNLILSDKIIRINMTDTYFYKDYLIMVLNSPQIRNMIVGLMSGMDKQQVNISQDKYKTLLIPIPPFEEQKRIVAKLEEILPLCERLK